MTFEELQQYSKGIKIDNIGMFKADSFSNYLNTLNERKQYSKIQYRSLESFIKAGQCKEFVKTVIVILVNYFVEDVMENEDLKLSNYSRFCWSSTNPKAKEIVTYIVKQGFRAEVVDLPDRAAACKAGLGFIGKNNMFYGKGLGSYVGIRCIGTDWEFETVKEYDEVIHNSACNNCGKCIEACPVQAIMPQGYAIDPLKCISFLNRHPEEPDKKIPQDFGKLKNWLHGCEICQKVCPINKDVESGKGVVRDLEIKLYGLELPNKMANTRKYLRDNLDKITDYDFREHVIRLIGNNI